MMESFDESTLKQRYEEAGQAHVFEHYETLNTVDREKLLTQLSDIQVGKIATLLKLAKASSSAAEGGITIEPFVGENIGSSTVDVKLTKQYYDKGLSAIAHGEVAALVLAGGQGTRLGFDGPKGCYDIGLPSKKTLFQLMAERVLKLKQLASESVGKMADECSLPFYIMTSPINHQATTDFFKENDFFGLGQSNVIFFPQGMLPCLTDEGKIIMEEAGKVSMAPDGNGGIYPSLLASGSLDDMAKNRNIKYLHVFSIDNALVKPADPAFIGFCIAKEADCGNKSTRKSHPHEKVGVVALRNGKPCVVEYSEITKDMAESTDDKGRLVFGAANICNHFYTIEFLRNTVLPNLGNLYHIAKKKIPYYDASTKAIVKPESNNGIKLESFIFDVFPLSTNFAVWEVERAQEFAPVKNASGSPADSPDTARSLLSSLCKNWLEQAGANISTTKSDAICEISPLLSYGGEGLEEYKDSTIETPCNLSPSTKKRGNQNDGDKVPIKKIRECA